MPLLRQSTVSRTRTMPSQRLIIEGAPGGVNTLFSETTLSKKEAKELTNCILVEDGVPTPRWGTAAYGGVTWTATPDGAKEYRKDDGTRRLIVVADGSAYVVDPVAATKTLISGSSAYFTAGTRVYMMQINSRLYISDSLHNLAYYDGTVLQSYSALATPTWAGTPLARTGLTAGSFSYFYRVTASNAVGESIAAAEQTITVNKLRDNWDVSNYLTLDWNDVTNATNYTVYMSDAAGYEVKLADVSVSTYIDDGTAAPNPYIEPPNDNTTAGPKLGPMDVSANRIWGVADPDNPFRAYFSGTGVNLGTFSTAFDGGWINLEKGGRAPTVMVKDFQGSAHVFTKTPNGAGSVWQVTVQSVTIAGEQVPVPIATKIVGQTGCDAPRSVIEVENDIMMHNSLGMFVLGNEPGVLTTVLRTKEMTAKIRPDIKSISPGKSQNVCSYYFDGKVLVSVALAAGANDHIYVFDRERGAFIKFWSIGVEQFLEFTDASNVTHLLGIHGTGLIEFSDNYQTDSGVSFTWTYTTARPPFSRDWGNFAIIPYVLVRLREASGTISVSIIGTGRNEQVSAVASHTITQESSNTGLGWDEMGNFQMGQTAGIPTTFASQSLVRKIMIPPTKRRMRDIQFTFTGDSVAGRCIVLGALANVIPDTIDGPQSWRV